MLEPLELLHSTSRNVKGHKHLGNSLSVSTKSKYIYNLEASNFPPRWIPKRNACVHSSQDHCRVPFITARHGKQHKSSPKVKWIDKLRYSPLPKHQRTQMVDSCRGVILFC